MIRIIVLVLLWISSITFAQTSSEIFAKANTLYTSGKYDLAIDNYKKILKDGKVSSTLYYNLGNCYYKLNAVAPAIYNYEKALQLNPSNSDAKNNLAFAKKLTLDRIEPLPETLSDNLHYFFKKLPYETWGILAVICSMLTALCFLTFYFSVIPFRKKIFFTGGIVSVIMLLSSLGIALFQYNKIKNSQYAIIFSKVISVKNEPIPTAEEIFILHEGTKVKVLDAVDTWKKIKLVDGKIGWLDSTSIKEI